MENGVVVSVTLLATSETPTIFDPVSISQTVRTYIVFSYMVLLVIEGHGHECSAVVETVTISFAGRAGTRVAPACGRLRDMNSSLWLACWIPSHLSSVEDVAGSSSGVCVLSEKC